MLRRLLTNYPLVNILFTLVIAMGVLSYATMPREQDPEINFNWVNITTILPGASAENMEDLVTGPLEDAIGTVKDIKFVSSNTREGVSTILIRFRELSERAFDKRLKDIRREVQNKANDELPEDIIDPEILEVTTSSGFPTALVVVSGQADDEVLRRAARGVRQDLERMPGVDDVLELGLHDPEIQVLFDPVSLSSRGLLATDIADGLQRSFRDVSAGTLQAGAETWSVQVDGATADIDTLAQFRVAPLGDPFQTTALADVARVERVREEPNQLASFNGEPAVSLSVTKVGYTNTLDLIQRIAAYVDERNAVLAQSGVQLHLADDQTIKTRQSITIMQTNALLGLALVLLVCWAFLGLRIASFVTLGIGFSIAGTFWLLAITGNTLNISVLLGVVIVLGMLVDDAVVVVEAIYYRLQRGTAPVDAAIGALGEVAKPVTSAVATTIAAFLPLMLLPGIVGDFMFVIPFVVTVGLAISLVEAFWILPSHLSTDSHRASPDNRSGRRWRITHTIRVKYTRALIRVMRRPALALAAGLAGFILAVGALYAGLVKVDFFTMDPFRLFYINVDMPPETPLDETLKETQRIERLAREWLDDDEVRAITALAGIKFTDIEPLYGDQYGQIQVSLHGATADSRPVPEIVDSMRDSLVAAGGRATISFLEIEGGPPVSAPVNVKVRADDFDELRAAADAVKTIVERDVPGSYNVTDDDVSGKPELSLVFDHAAIRRAGLTPGTVARLVRLHTDGEVVAFTRDAGEKVELRVRSAITEQGQITDLLADPVALPNGGTTTLGALVQSEARVGRGLIRHYNFRRTITVQAELDEEVNNALTAGRQILDAWEEARVDFPGASLDLTGELDDIQESLNAMGGLFLLGLGLMYLILATQFRSYFQPFLILVTVPLAFTGVVLGLVTTRNPLSLYSLYGIIALTGIAVNSAIVLIDAANARLAAGMSTLHATLYAARRRVVPIIMTTTTTIAGLSSLALGLGGKSLLWGPVASSIVAGLLVATPMTLFIVPILYRQFMRGRAKERQVRAEEDWW
ncbi:MAG: efflux RND transporter permease subunit [Pseudomonadota bacterium]